MPQVEGEDWRHRAAFREEDPELFFPIGETGVSLLQIEEAKAVCRRCPVLISCLAWALETRQETGVWGGISESERRHLRRRANRHDMEPAALAAKERTAKRKVSA
ncbi:WhiB family transcriptional regulator [Kitasatospora cinereorecta]|uniref:Transcriptional regulator WhiB n=1 Tax=Kitasatospora cinereorecta TaxID=285560 RepID=A0ABW0VMW8_9ACTN